MNSFKGIHIPLLTPFHEDGSLALELIPGMVEHHIENGVDGFYVGGSSGEAFLMTDEERVKLMEAVAKACKNRVGMMAHIGSIGTDKTLALGLTAMELGYDSVSSVPPFYYGFSKEETKDYYLTLADKIELPMVIYNVPATTGVGFSVEEVSEMMEHPRIVGIKHTTADMFMVERLRKAAPESIIFHGCDEMLTAGLLFGANGGIGSTYNLMSKHYVELFKLTEEKRFAEAFELQKQANEITDIMIKEGLFPSMKYLLKKRGIDCGYARKPFKTLSDEAKARLDEAVTLIP